MNRLLLAIALIGTLAMAAGAQDPNPAPQAGMGPGGFGQRGGRGPGGMMGRGLSGTVTEAAADHFTIKTNSGETYTVRFGSDTRFMKQGAGMRGPGDGASGQRRTPPQQPEIKAADIKAGDTIDVMGETDATAKSITARAIVQVDPERARQMQAQQANFGKTWLMGKITAIDGTRITLTGGQNNASYSFAADENTQFRKRRDPVTLMDLQVGDTVRVEGALKDGVFTATTVSVGGMMGGEAPMIPRTAPPQ